MNAKTLLLGLLLLVALAAAAKPTPPSGYGSLTQFANCSLSCSRNATDYVCHFGEHVYAECYARNSTAGIIPYQSFQFEIEGNNRTLLHAYQFNEIALRQASFDGTILAEEFQLQSGAGGGCAYEFDVKGDFFTDERYHANMYANGTESAIYFYVNGDSISTLRYNKTIQSGEDIQWRIFTEWRDQDDCTMSIIDPATNRGLRQLDFTWAGREHYLNYPSHGLAWQDYWLNITCGRTTAQQTLNIAFNRFDSEDAKGWVALAAGNAQWIALAAFLLAMAGFAYRAWRKGVI